MTPVVNREAGADPKRPPYALWVVASLTLGLAPFVPEPHIIGKVRWVLGGAKGMGLADWWDFVMHGAPWVGLAVTALLDGVRRLRRAG